MDSVTAYPKYIAHSLVRLEQHLPRATYALLLIAIRTRTIRCGMVRALVGLCNTYPVPTVSPAMLARLIILDSIAHGVTLEQSKVLQAWLDEVALETSTKRHPDLEK